MKNPAASNLYISSMGSGLRNTKGSAVTNENAKAIMNPSQVPQIF